MKTTTKKFTRNGHEHEIRAHYYGNGTMWFRAHYWDGYLHGLNEGWYPDGKLEYREYWKNGELVWSEEA